MRYKETQTLVLAKGGFEKDRPYLLINDIEEKTQEKFFPLGNVFSLKKREERYCIGSFDLATHVHQACPLAVELPADFKEERCPACRELTGFNPAFYHTPSISPQQRVYNNTEHFVYVAYFSPTHIKAGISSETRGITRLLEQGARAALIVGRFPNAEKARELEVRLCADEHIFETMRSTKKAELVSTVHYDFNEACCILERVAARFGLATSEACLDLDRYYWESFSLAPDDLQLPADGFDNVCGGRCVAMIGSLLVFEQEGIGYVISTKEWETHAIELYQDEVLHVYSFEPMQMSLL